MARTTIPLLAWLILVSVTCAPALAQEAAANANLRTISTAGEAVIYVVPDEAVVTLGVETFNADLDKSKAANDSAAQTLVKAIKSMGIDDKYVGTDQVQVEIRYRSEGREISGYVTRRAYSVKLKDPKQTEALVSLALKSGANMLSGVELRTTELRKHRDDARSMAIKAAKEKAIALARDLECTVGAPRNISESGSVYSGGGYQFGNRYAYSQNSVQTAPGEAGEGGETMPLGQIAVRATVSVTFDLLPPPGAR